MEEMKNLEYIQLHIGYRFKRFELLCQAFTRKSYSEENRNAQNNEVLEFYGDKALDFVVTKMMSEYYGAIREGNCFVSSVDEGKLTEMKKQLVCRSMLSKKIKELGFHNRLIMGKSDYFMNVKEQESVMEDLFEAIIGSVAIDSNWDINALTIVVERMLNPKFYFENGFEDLNYIAMVQQWSQKKYGSLPEYRLTNGIKMLCLFKEYSKEEIPDLQYQCDLIIPYFDTFQALGRSQNEARMRAAQKAYQYLEKNRLLINPRDEIGAPDFERSINQVQELYQKGYISQPIYEFKESKDENGNSIWECWCNLESAQKGYSGMGSTKVEAKKKASYRVAWIYLGEADSNEEQA